MLVLARKTDESIIIGDDIHVKIISIEKGVVKLGIDAPADVSIIREELARDIAKMNKEASLHAEDGNLEDLTKLIKR